MRIDALITPKVSQIQTPPGSGASGEKDAVSGGGYPRQAVHVPDGFRYPGHRGGIAEMVDAIIVGAHGRAPLPKTQIRRNKIGDAAVFDTAPDGGFFSICSTFEQHIAFERG